MNPLQLHLLVVHLPVLACPAAAGLVLVSRIVRSEILFKTACVFLLIAFIGGGAAFFSGPAAYEGIEVDAATKELIEEHAALGKGAFMGLVLLGLAALLALLQYPQGERPAPWLRWVLLIASLLMTALLAWAAHQGGLASHPELRG